jgi:3-isopropylmalate/(R)-2-methylmalate dehydratase large subunit
METDRWQPRTLFEKIWARHSALQRADGLTLLYVDRQFIHDGSDPAFEMLRKRGLKPRTPERTFATADHYVPTTNNRALETIDNAEKRHMVASFDRNTQQAGILGFGMHDPRQGIVHVVGPEQGISQPGLVIVCCDSHTSTHGALGALAFGIGMSEVAHVLATQTLWQRKPKTMRVSVEGRLGPHVVAKDVILAIIAKIGAAGGTGHVIEYAGSTIRGLTMEGRLTLCNMSIEAGARAGMVAPDDTTYSYLAGRPFAPEGADWERALARWRALPTDDHAVFDSEVSLDAQEIAPMITWGISPQDALPITGSVPDPSQETDSEQRSAMERALAYMGLTPGLPFNEIAIDRVFVGSCTNGRIEDLRAAAAVAKGRKVSPQVQAWVVPGSGLVKTQAEREGLDRIFTEAGFEWRQAGCSTCLGTNGEIVAPGQRCASTTNRNFAGRQGPGARTHLMSPQMAVAAAVTGKLTDVRLLGEVGV